MKYSEAVGEGNGLHGFEEGRRQAPLQPWEQRTDSCRPHKHLLSVNSGHTHQRAGLKPPSHSGVSVLLSCPHSERFSSLFFNFFIAAGKV